MSFIQRKFLAKLGLGCLEIRIETGRYARPRLPEEERTCQICPNQGQAPETELHFLFQCEAYTNERAEWLRSLEKPDNFPNLSTDEQLKLVLDLDKNVKKLPSSLLRSMINVAKL